jgi:crossover junction endodeoxyribonuclease RuvC
MSGERRVLGVDPGLTRCGVAVVDGAPGRRVSLHYIGVVRTAADDPIEQRLVELERELAALVAEHRPDVVAVERVFSQHNVRTAMATAQAAAVALLVAARNGIDVAMHTPTEVKAAVTGSGRADKAQVTAMVTRVLSLSKAPSPADAADAAAIAICQAWRGAATARLDAAREQMAARR